LFFSLYFTDRKSSGLYFHIDTKNFFIATGMYEFTKDQLKKYRKLISSEKNAVELKKLITNTLKKGYILGGLTYKKVPRGFDKEHQHIEDLKRKSFFLMRREPPEIILDDGFVGEVEKTFRAAKPLMDYICYAQDIEI